MALYPMTIENKLEHKANPLSYKATNLKPLIFRNKFVCKQTNLEKARF